VAGVEAAEGGARPFPPGEYPVVVVGSGPGGLQMSSCLSELGVPHAVVSRDDRPGGMFQKWPIFQRLISWSKPYSPLDKGSRAYEWHDWNSLLADDPRRRVLVADHMDGTSYFPARSEMESALSAFAERAGVQVRYGCSWEGTRREGDGFVVETSDGAFRCRALVMAIGSTTPWKPPDIQGIELVPHYAETREPGTYSGKTVVLIGKRNSGFEVADGLLPYARQIFLVSPSPAKFSVLTHSTTGARARYLQPYEDHVLGGGNFVIDAALQRIERHADGKFHVHASGTTRPGDLMLDADEVIAVTGFTTPLLDLPELGVQTVAQGRFPVQTPFFESPGVPGLYFAGCATQGQQGLKKYGLGPNSAAVQGFRYNARVTAEHLARTRLGIDRVPPRIEAAGVVDHFLTELAEASVLRNQPSFLARAVTFDPVNGIVDDGVVPLAAFVDGSGADAAAVAIETDDTGDIHPAVYVRRDGRVTEHLLPGHPLLDFRTPEHRAMLEDLLKPFLG
jgi:thioredoxin reductase